MPDETPAAPAPAPEEMTDEKVDKLVTHVLDKMGVSGIPERELARAEADVKRQEASVEQAKAIQGQMQGLMNLVGALQGMEAALHTLANAEGRIARDADLIKRFLKRLDPKGFMEQLEARESPPSLEAPEAKPGLGGKKH